MKLFKRNRRLTEAEIKAAFNAMQKDDVFKSSTSVCGNDPMHYMSQEEIDHLLALI